MNAFPRLIKWPYRELQPLQRVDRIDEINLCISFGQEVIYLIDLNVDEIEGVEETCVT